MQEPKDAESNLKMKTKVCNETCVRTHKIIWCHNQETRVQIFTAVKSPGDTSWGINHRETCGMRSYCPHLDPLIAVGVSVSFFASRFCPPLLFVFYCLLWYSVCLYSIDYSQSFRTSLHAFFIIITLSLPGQRRRRLCLPLLVTVSSSAEWWQYAWPNREEAIRG